MSRVCKFPVFKEVFSSQLVTITLMWSANLGPLSKYDMERRLYKAITVPAMILAWGAAGAILYLLPEYLSQLWFQIKIACGLGLVWSTLYAGSIVKLFAIDSPN